MTIEQFRQIHEDWKQSGLSVQQYCENTGLTESRFYYWKSKLKAESLPSACGSFILRRWLIVLQAMWVQWQWGIFYSF
jgi:hypothetical protein